MSDKQPVMRIRGLQKQFGDQTVLKGIDLDVYPGEKMAIIGGTIELDGVLLGITDTAGYRSLREEISEIMYKMLEVNGMTDGAHLRLMITRGRKRTPNQDPHFIIGGTTVVCVAEYKVVDDEVNSAVWRCLPTAIAPAHPMFLTFC